MEKSYNYVNYVEYIPRGESMDVPGKPWQQILGVIAALGVTGLGTGVAVTGISQEAVAEMKEGISSNAAAIQEQALTTRELVTELGNTNAALKEVTEVLKDVAEFTVETRVSFAETKMWQEDIEERIDDIEDEVE